MEMTLVAMPEKKVCCADFELMALKTLAQRILSAMAMFQHIAVAIDGRATKTYVSRIRVNQDVKEEPS